MSIKASDLTSKLKELQSVYDEGLERFSVELENTRSDKAGLGAVLENDISQIFPNAQSLDNQQILAALAQDEIKTIAEMDSQNARLDAQQKKIISGHGVATYEELEDLQDRTDENIKKAQESLRKTMDDVQERRYAVKYILDHNYIYSKYPLTLQTIDAYLKQETALEKIGSFFHALVSPGYARAKRYVAQVQDLKQKLTDLGSSEDAYDQSKTNLSNLRTLAEEIRMSQNNITGLVINKFTLEDKLSRIKSAVLKNVVSKDTSPDIWVSFLSEDRRAAFLETAIKHRGLEKIEAFLNGKVESLKKDSSNTAKQLKQLSRVSASKTIKNVDPEQLDTMIAAAKTGNERLGSAASRLRADTVTYNTASTTYDNGFTTMIIAYWALFLMTDSSVHAAENAAVLAPSADVMNATGFDATLNTPEMAEAFSSLSIDTSQIDSGLSSASLESALSDNISSSVSDSISSSISSSIDSGISSSSYDSGGFSSGGGFDGGSSASFAPNFR